jgi:ABC-type uncharacterized transport system permease subunit
MKTVRAATQCSLFFIVPLLLLVQFGYEPFLQGVALPLAALVLSVVACVCVALVGMRKFASL